MPEENVGKKIKKFSLETRLKSSEDFKNKVLGMFRDYIKSIIVFGSFLQGKGTGKSDVDIYIIFDDTKMPLKKFEEIREKIDKDIFSIASSIDPRLHPQPILALTEFIKGIRYTHPLFFNIIRSGYAIYDTGFFIPMRKLLEWGEFPITPEAAHTRMDPVEGRIKRVKNVKLYMIAEDLYYALLDSAQAVLMYIGIGPPHPKTAADDVRKYLVEPGFLEEEYAKMLEDVVAFRKKVEYKELEDVSGQEVDEWIKKSEKYVERFQKLLKDLETKRKEEDIKKNYDTMIKASVAVLKNMNKLPPEPEKLPEAFNKYLIEAGLISSFYSDVFENVIRMRKMLEDKKIEKITEREIYTNKEYVIRFINDVRKFIEPVKEKTVEEKIDETKEPVKEKKTKRTKKS